MKSIEIPGNYDSFADKKYDLNNVLLSWILHRSKKIHFYDCSCKISKLRESICAGEKKWIAVSPRL